MYGLRGKINDWISSYLSQRSQVVEIHGCKSNKLNVECGAPQGSVLGPLLFIVFINDLANVGNQDSLTLFADDTSFVCSGLPQNDVVLYSQNILNVFVESFKKNTISKYF